MRPRRSLLVAFALVVAACTGSTEPSTTTATQPGPTTTSETVTASTIDPALATALPVDPDLKTGVLDNGLTYYIRFNDSPGGRVELRLLVNAGSVQEDDDQSGGAHFLEHMMFNGTERFPRNELIGVLESFGPRFGPDINAHTSFDETVYELSLVADDELIELGLDVLREWASEATLTEEDVIQERGVVLDEWRLRAQGFGGRYGDAFQDLILPGTGYENRVPIGDPDSIETTTSDELSRFYTDWYRPDLMAVVVVGDVDTEDMESLIKDNFSDLGTPEDPRPYIEQVFEAPSMPRASRFTDEESTGASVTVLWPDQSSRVETVGQVQSRMARSMALGVLAERLNDDALRGISPILGSTAVDFGFGRAIQLPGVDVRARPQDLTDALRALFMEVRRLESFGLFDEEFDRAITRSRVASEQVHEQQETRQDVAFVNQITTFHLAGGDLMSPDQRFEIESGVLDRLTKDDVEGAFALVVETPPTVLAVGPDDPDAVIPSSDEIIELMAEVETATITARPETGTEVDSLMAAPEQAPISGSDVDSTFGYTTLTFENGATVYLWQSDIAEESVFFSAESFGGTSTIEVEDLPEAFLITEIIARSGVGPADVPTLERLLADKIVGVGPWLSETREGLTGSSSASDVEVLFQLIHLYMTAPRIDDVAVTTVLDEIAVVNASRDDVPDILFSEALDRGYYGDDPRYFVLPSADQLAEFDVNRAEEVYRERFGNAGDFAFAFVGDFDVAEMTELASSYLGSLPGSPGREGFVDNQPLPRREVQVLTVEAGSDPQGRVAMFFTNEFDPVPEDRLTARVLELIVNARLRDRIREELSATYSPSAGIDLQRDPDPFAESFINVTGDPNDLDRIADEVDVVLADLLESGPNETEFNTALTQLTTELGLINNVTIADALTNSYLYPDEPVTYLREQFQLVTEITAADVTTLARVAFNPNQRIEVRLVPRP